MPHTGRLASLYERRSGMRPQRSAMFAIVVLSPPVDGRRSGPLSLMMMALDWRAAAVSMASHGITEHVSMEVQLRPMHPRRTWYDQPVHAAQLLLCADFNGFHIR